MIDSVVHTTPAPRRINLRRIWLKIHRWVALSVGWILAAVGLMGAILIVAQPLDKWMHPEFFKADTASISPMASLPAVSLQTIREQLTETFGNKVTFNMRPPRDAGDTFWVLVRGEPWSGTVYLNPVTGKEQGRRGEYDGFVNVTFKLHSALLLQDTGKAILAWISLAYLILLISGLVLWWPKRWPPSLKIELRKGVLRGLFDMHRIGGAVLGLLIAVSVATGAYMAWRPLGQFVTTLSGSKAIKPPAISKDDVAKGPAISLDELAAHAQAQFPDDQIGYIFLPVKKDQAVRVRMKLADDPHPNGLTSVYLHPKTGEVLAVNRWNELDPGARAFSIVYPLHTGELGGVLLEAVTFISGLALGMLGITGIWLWWRRRT
jgi:uncharacterized iron-regulated membrane protein